EGTGENIQDYICRQQFRGYKIDYSSRGCSEGYAVEETFVMQYTPVDMVGPAYPSQQTGKDEHLSVTVLKLAFMEHDAKR
ncbi:hypothetical protein BaRGS_00010080, partial [Batillaria attramentaria]